MSDTMRGLIWMLGTIVSFSAMAVSGRELAGALDTFEIMLYRSMFGLIVVVAIIAVTNRWSELRTHRFGAHVLRNITHFTGQNLWFYALAFIPLSQVFALEFTTPLWVLLLSPLLLGERFTSIRLVSALLGFAGILFVAQPGTTSLSTGVLAAASCAIFFALSVILTKRLTTTDSIACIMFYLTLVQLFLGLVTAGYDGNITLPTWQALPYVLAIGLCGLSAHFCYTKALSLAPAAVVSPIDFGRLPTIAIVGWLIYAEPLDPWIFLGAAIIFLGNYLNIWSETRKRA
ncbi:MAG: DMT family transporter [Paracoccaceae bacterium]